MVLLMSASSVTWVVVGGALFGCAATMGNVCISVLLPTLFGTEHQGAIQGAAMTGALNHTHTHSLTHSLSLSFSLSLHLYIYIYILAY